ncbi:predicted protein [Naegleria gruberi]|uniref:Bifunctional lysine-specific demethylase and histidyl-hydroxylase n=1 Tax=Naegleria gruberi TaxID=5762 RepID=D2VJG1_NAEGR|nr:uncharacterized protein NAEGRDRAFT_50047 [Naegleria gruberi]EFC42938.1 predicted protein [Naegleria gruberi]|eukprot:XP_002675682.1 predicted protein [Naegleria gruberi strain NEG-M]
MKRGAAPVSERLLKKVKQGSGKTATSGEEKKKASSSSSAEKKVEIQYCNVPLMIEPESEEEEPILQPAEIKKEQLVMKHTPKDGIELMKNPKSNDSRAQGKSVLDWVYAPIDMDKLYQEFVEKRVLVIRRNEVYPDYYKGLYSLDEIKKTLVDHELRYSYDLDLALYRNGRRFTLNPNKDDVADPTLVWDLYENEKCSIRMLRPQEHSDVLLSLLCHFEEYFGQGAGLNAYLTPAGSQGFAPHYDDIEAFLIQLEGEKHWKIYRPLENQQYLDRFSSKNFTQEEVAGFECFEILLKPGDMLYVPKGVIHQAVTSQDQHSLHITVSTSHLMSWTDYLEKALPLALQMATENHVDLRTALPKDFKEYMGTNIAECEDPRREEFILKCSEMVGLVMNSIPMDQAADEMVKKFMHDRHVSSGLSILREKSNKDQQISEATVSKLKVRLATANTAHIVIDNLSEEKSENQEEEEEVFSIIYSSQNTRVYHEVELQHLDLDGIFLEAVQTIFTAYPKSVKVADLPNLSDEEKVMLIEQLVGEKIVELA